MDRRLFLILPYLFWFLAFIVAPFLLVLGASFAVRNELGEITFAFTAEAYRELLDPVYLKVLFRTGVMALAHTAFTLLVAFPVAFFLSRLPRREAGIYLTLLLVPFWTNYLIRLLAFMDVLRLQFFGVEWTYTFSGVLLALIYNYLPFAILPLYTALEKIPQSVLEAALDLGASKRKVLLHVLFPLSRKALAATGILLFVPALGEFLIPEIVGGGKFYYLGTFLQQQFLVSRNWPLGAAAVVLLIALSLLLVLVCGKALGDDKQ